MVPQLIVAVVVVALDRRLLEGPVHALDLAIGPRVVWLGEPMLDVVRLADLIEAVDAVRGSRAATVLGQLSELDAVVGQDGVQAVRTGPMRALAPASSTSMPVQGAGSRRADTSVLSLIGWRGSSVSRAGTNRTPSSRLHDTSAQRACRRHVNSCEALRPRRSATARIDTRVASFSETMAAFSSADQLRRLPAPVNSSSRRNGSNIAIRPEIDRGRRLKSAPNVPRHSVSQKGLSKRRLR